MSAKRKSRFLAGALGTALCVVTLSTRPARAEIIHVPDDYPTIQQAIWLRSAAGPEVTTIDGAGLNTSVVWCVNEEGPDTILEGFTITHGNAEQGGGSFVGFVSFPTVTDGTFKNNEAEGIRRAMNDGTRRSAVVSPSSPGRDPAGLDSPMAHSRCKATCLSFA